ncbi:MAG: hypothetical protein HKP27_15090, partial [Myxococcales bacterium]|nr:hypothetical protein [Myxococcales bacterium]
VEDSSGLITTGTVVIEIQGADGAVPIDEETESEPPAPEAAPVEAETDGESLDVEESSPKPVEIGALANPALTPEVEKRSYERLRHQAFENTSVPLADAVRTSGPQQQSAREDVKPEPDRGYLHPAFLESIEILRRQLAEHAAEEGGDVAWISRAFQGLTVAGTAGLLTALMRASSLAAIGFSAVPLWRRVDPLTVLSLNEDERRELAASLKAAEAEEEGLDRVLRPQKGAREKLSPPKQP